MTDKLGPGWAEAAAKAAIKGDTNHDQIMRATGKRPFSRSWQDARTQCRNKGTEKGASSHRLDGALGPIEDD